MLHRLLISLALFALTALSASAQSKNISVSVEAVDTLTLRSLPRTHVSLLQADSTEIDTFTVINIDLGFRKKYLYYCELPQPTAPRAALVRLERKGYETTYVPVTLGTDDVDLGQVMMQRAYRQLGEAVVTASKVMMVMQGDTLVYNADAFQLAEGSMLDELIAQLPGVKLESGGRITVNGNFVSALLVNGKDFFHGDPNVALANLPAYMVSKVKAYQRKPDDAYLTRPDSMQRRADDPWVLDVRLKRQYAQGWIANAEAGYGTDDRWMGRLFAMRFTDNSRLAAYTSANNLNRTGSPSSDSGDWAEENEANGLLTRKQGGLDVLLYNKQGTANFSTTLTASRTETDLQTYSASTSFLPNGDTYGQSRTSAVSKATQVDWQNSLSLTGGTTYFYFQPLFTYSRTTMDSRLQQAEWNAAPVEQRRGAALDSCFLSAEDATSWQSLTYTLSNVSHSVTTYWQTIGVLNLTVKPFHHLNAFQLLADGSYSLQRAREASHYDLQQPSVGTPDRRNRYERTPKRQYAFTVSVVYPLLNRADEKGLRTLSLAYDYKQSLASGSRSLYRLEQLGGRWEQMDDASLGLLPSTTDSLTMATDWDNTSHTTEFSRSHKVALSWFSYKSTRQISLSLPVLFTRDRISDLRGLVPRRRTRHNVVLQPRLDITYRNVRAMAYTERVNPSLLLLLDTRDDSNPLATFLGNPDLKPTDNYYARFDWHGAKMEVQRNWNLHLGYVLTRNAVGQTRQYIRQSGGYIYTPRNINGNHCADASFAFSQAVDKQKHWTLSLDTKFNYQRSADFAEATSESFAAASTDAATSTAEAVVRSIVHNFDYVQSLGLDFRKGEFHAGFKASADWGRATSSRLGFETISTVDMLYRLTLHAPIVWGISADTDLNLFARTGYGDASMNTSQWVWNASLSRALDRQKKFTLRLSAHDLLTQTSPVRRTINAQGRTETWNNALTRYVMLHLSYRFSVSPKRHGDEAE